MNEQIPLVNSDLAAIENLDDGTLQVLPDLAFKRLLMVNVVFYGVTGAGDRQWVLVDTGLPGSAGAIRRAAAKRFGPDARPAAIILTHGHFDHVGSLKTLAEEWDVPIYAHPMELPYLDGTSSYPPPDALIGGFMALTSPLYPRGPIDVRPRLQELPEDGTVPFMPGWQWIATPGHSPGHVSLWREEDSTLISGDAVITTRQEAVYSVATQEPEMHGPPMYFTPDWTSAEESVRKLTELEPELILPGHGQPMQGDGMRESLHQLAENFREVAVPEGGRYTPKKG